MAPAITITSEELRERVEEHLGRWIPDSLWERSEPYARRKLDLCRERNPEIDYYNDEYLVLLTADTIRGPRSATTPSRPARPSWQPGASERRNPWKQQKKGPPAAIGRPLRENPTACQLTDPALKV